MGFLRTGLLFAVLTGLFIAIGAIVGGQTGMVIAFLLAAGLNAFAYWNSDKMVLRMHGAVETDEGSAPELFSIVRQLAANAELPMPRVYVMHNPQPNAFATGRDPEHAAVAATTGLLEMLSKEEVAGVIAHELAHVKNRDTLTMAMVATLAGAISMLAQWGLFFGGRQRDNPLGPIASLLIIIAAPLAATLVQMGISRTREYAADELGSQISGQPLWLASALRKLQAAKAKFRNRTAEAAPATAHMFIINPLFGSAWQSWFMTHPPTEERIARLEAIARELGQSLPQTPTGPRVAEGQAAKILRGGASPWG